jgi:hypothetical protein
MKWILYSAAILAFVSFCVAGFAQDGTNLYIGASVLLLLSSVTCWIGSIYIWSVSNQTVGGVSPRSRCSSCWDSFLAGFMCSFVRIKLDTLLARH